MAKYIEYWELDAAAKMFCAKCYNDCSECRLIEFIDEAYPSVPTVDVVEVIRCKDCAEYVGGQCCRNIHNHMRAEYMKPDDYCSYGKERT